MSIPNHSFHLTLTPSGVADSRYPDGDDGGAAIPLVWAAIPSSLGHQEGTPFSFDVRSYLTEPGSPAATLSLVGTAPAGWSLSGDNVQYSGTGTGIAAIQVRATRLGFTVDSAPFTVESIPSAAADTVPPTIPTGLTATLISGPAVVLAWDASSDVKTPAVTASGLKDYQVTRAAPIGSPVLAPSVGLSAQLALQNIGTLTPATSGASQSGPDYTLTCGGDAAGLAGSADALAFYGVQITGDFTLTSEVTLATGPSANSKAGLMIRQDLSATSVFVAIHHLPDSGADSGGLVMQSRPTTGAAVITNATVPGLTGAILMRIRRSGDVFSTAYWDNTQWVALSSQTVVGTPPAIWVGLCANSALSGSSISPTWAQMNLQNIAGSTYTDSAVSAGSSYSYTVSARDVNNNVSAASNSVSINVPAPNNSPAFPRLGAFPIGGTQSKMLTSAVYTYFQAMDVTIVNGYDGFDSGKSFTTADMVNAVHAGAKKSTGALVFRYFNAQKASTTTIPNVATLNAGNWWVRSSYPAGSIALHNGLGVLNLTAGGNSIGGRTYVDYSADYPYDYCVNGGALGLDVGVNAPNPNLDGIYLDDLFFTTPVAGDWDRNGSSESAGNTTDSQALRTARASQYSRLMSLMPAKRVIANLSQLQSADQPQTGISAMYHGGIMEGMLGVSWGAEVWSGWAKMMQGYARQMDFCQAPKLCLFAHSNLTSSGRDFYRTNAYQALRYGLTACLMGDGYYAQDAIGTNTPGTGGSGYRLDALPQWFDEFAVDPTTGVAKTYPDVAAGLGYLGYPNEPGIITTAWQLGVMRRTFTHPTTGITWWVFNNPKGNGARTVSLGQTLRKLTGTQNPTVNSGALVSSVSLLDSDGIILMVPP